MKLTNVGSYEAWIVDGASAQYPNVFTYSAGDHHPDDHLPGVLVTSNLGQDRVFKQGEMGLGVIVAVRQREVHHYSHEVTVTVLWNWDGAHGF